MNSPYTIDESKLIITYSHLIHDAATTEEDIKIKKKHTNLKQKLAYIIMHGRTKRVITCTPSINKRIDDKEQTQHSYKVKDFCQMH